MSELLLTSSIDQIEEGQVFSKSLPRHVTVWQYFTLPDFHIEPFIQEVGEVVEGFSPLWIRGGENANFGPDETTPVRKVIALGRNATLRTLHTVLGSVIERHEGAIADPQWAYEHYNPHVTYVEGQALEEHESFKLTTLELIEKDPTTREKIVRKIWELTDE